MIKKEISQFDKNIFQELDRKWAILTAGDANNSNSMLVSWGGIGALWGKAVAFVFVRKSRYTYNFINQYSSVSLSFLSDKFKEEKKIFGSKSGRDIDKFKQTGLHRTLDHDTNGYYVSEAEYVINMQKIYAIDLPFEQLSLDLQKKFYPTLDMHTMYICEIKNYLVSEE